MLLALGKVKQTLAKILLGIIKNLFARQKREAAMEEKLRRNRSYEGREAVTEASTMKILVTREVVTKEHP